MKKLLRYYKNYTPIFALGALFVVVGALIYYFSWELWVLGTPLILIGVGVLVVGFTLRISDQTYGAYFTGKIDSVKSGRRIESEPDYTAAEYSFDGNTYSRLDSAQKPRSEKFVQTELSFKKNELSVECFRVDLADDTIDTDKHVFSLAEVTASLEEKELRVKGALKKVVIMTVADSADSAVFPVRYNDIEVDTLVSRINDAKIRM